MSRLMNRLFGLTAAFFLMTSQSAVQSEMQGAAEYPSSEIYGARVEAAKVEQADDDKITKHFHPRVVLGLEYDDNIFLTPEDEQDDLLFIVSPGILIPVPFDAASHLFSIDYHSDIAFFSDFNDQDFDNHYIVGNLDLNFPKFYIKTYDDFRYTGVRANTEFEDRIDRYENYYVFNIGKDDIGKWVFEPGFSWYLVEYDEVGFEVLDRDEYTVGGTLQYQVRPKMRVLVDYRHVFIRYDETPERDGDADQIQVGITGQILRKLIGTIRGGYENRRYDDAPEQDFDSGIIGASLVWNYSDRTSFTLTGDRSVRESVFRPNFFYVQNAVSLIWNQKLFFERLDGRLRGSYQVNDYEELTTVDGLTAEREDDLYGFDVGVEYKVKEWLTTGLDYFYLHRDSNFASFDFTDNRILWKVSVLF